MSGQSIPPISVPASFYAMAPEDQVQYLINNLNERYTQLRQRLDAASRAAITVQANNFPTSAFGWVRTADPYAIFTSKQLNDKQPTLWDEVVNGGAGTTSTHSVAHARTRMVIDDEPDAIVRQTFQRFNYQPGKGQLILMSFCANKADPSGVRFVIAKDDSVSESVEQADWNQDTFDGLGPSGIELDFSTAQIMFIAFEWLGEGTVDVGFLVDKTLYAAHSFHHANDVSSVYMETPNLPLSFTLQGDESSSPALTHARIAYGRVQNTTNYPMACGIYLEIDDVFTLDHICTTVISEGGNEPIGLSRALDMDTTALTLSASEWRPLLGIRLKDNYDTTIDIHNLSALSTSVNDNVLLRFMMNPTISGTFTYADLDDSACQGATNSSTSITSTGGDWLSSVYIHSQDDYTMSKRTQPKLGRSISGTADELVVIGKAIGSAADMLVALSWDELS